MSSSGCAASLRGQFYGDEKAVCKCSKYKIPEIKDVEFDSFIENEVSEKQMVIVAVTSSQ